MRVWASDEDYSSGPANGSSTKTDPGAGVYAQGWIPGTTLPAQHLNFVLNDLSARGAAELRRALWLHEVRLEGETIDDTSSGIAALSAGEHLETVVAKANTNGVLLAGDAEIFGLGGTLAAITGDVRGGVVRFSTGATRLVVIGDGGVMNAYSDNNGGSWTAGASTGFLIPPEDICLSYLGSTPVMNLVDAAGDTVASPNAETWTSPSAPNRAKDFVATATSIAALTSGVVVVCGLDSSGDVAFARSTDHGQNFAAASGTVANAATMAAPGGWVTGNGGAVLYHAGVLAGATSVQISVSADGNSWSTRATLPVGGGTVTGVRLRLCPNTGLLVLFVSLSSGVVEIRASLDSGVTWTLPSYAPGFALTGFAVAAGRIYATKGAQVFSSARVL